MTEYNLLSKQQAGKKERGGFTASKSKIEAYSGELGGKKPTFYKNSFNISGNITLPD